MRLFVAVLAALLLPAPAQAAWHEASSDHFVIYADDRAEDLRAFAERLERYHSALAKLTGQNLAKPSPSNRVAIYVVGSERDVKVLYGNKRSAVAGFYVPRAGGSVAFVPDLGSGAASSTNFALAVLLHEYAHHFLQGRRAYAMPRWFDEGAAEFFASARFEPDGGLRLGMAAQHRAGEIFFGDAVPIRELLDEDLYRAANRKRYDAFYGQSWTLYHYLTFEDSRKGQLARYVGLLTDGTKPLAAAEQAFGNLEKLAADLKSYVRRRQITSLKLVPAMTTVGPVAIRPLSPGMAAMMPVLVRSKRGVDEEEAKEVAAAARAIAAAHVGDPGFEAALAEAEYDAGNDVAAIAAADRALAAGPSIDAYVWKGRALFRQAGDAADRTAAYKAAMVPFTRLNKLENDHPLPLIHYYDSFEAQGLPPPEAARAALERAAMLVPQDKWLWSRMVLMLAQEGKIALARQMIAPLLADAHGGATAAWAAHVAPQLDKAPEGKRFTPDLAGLAAPVEGPDPDA